jgi:hypothetical protein
MSGKSENETRPIATVTSTKLNPAARRIFATTPGFSERGAASGERDGVVRGKFVREGGVKAFMMGEEVQS